MAEIIAVCDHIPLVAMAGEADRMLGCKIEELAGVVIKSGQGNPEVRVRRRRHGRISSCPQKHNYCHNTKSGAQPEPGKLRARHQHPATVIDKPGPRLGGTYSAGKYARGPQTGVQQAITLTWP